MSSRHVGTASGNPSAPLAVLSDGHTGARRLAPADGVAVTLYTHDDVKWLTAIEKALGYKIEKQNHAGETMSSRKKNDRQVKRGKSSVRENKRGKKNVLAKNSSSSRKQNKSN